MTWIIDDIPLSTLAFNVQNRSAGWKVPAKRGENPVIPGRNGAQWVPNKPFEQGQLTLSMWAVGANEDGTLPIHGDLARQARDNLDKLTALFAQSHKLLNVVKVLGKAFGAQNIVTNPAFEGVGVNYPAYTNFILNPAFRRNAVQTVMQNLLPNPNLLTLQSPTWTEAYHYANPDPANKFYRTGGFSLATLEDNYGTSFENYAAGATMTDWAVSAGVAATAQNAGAGDISVNPLGGTKVGRLLLSAGIASGAIIAHRAFYMFLSGRPNLRMRVRRAQNNTTARSINIRMIQVNSANNTVTGVTGPIRNFVLPSGTGSSSWIDVSYGYEGEWPAGHINNPQTYYRLEIRAGEAWVAGDGLVMDCINFRGRVWRSNNGDYATEIAMVGNDPSFPFYNVSGPYWNGNSPWGYTYWDVGPDTGASRWQGRVDSRWASEYPTSTANAYYAFTDVPVDTDPNGTTMGFIAFGLQAGGRQGFTLPITDFNVGDPYVLRFTGRALSGAVCNVQLQSKSPSDSDWVTRQDLSFTGTGSPAGTGSRMTGATLAMNGGLNTYRPGPDDELRVRVEVPVRTDGHHVFQLTHLAVTTGNFNLYGDSVNSTNWQYGWSGAAHASRSIAYGRRAKRVTSFHVVDTTLQPGGASAVEPILSVPALETSSSVPVSADFETVTIPADHQGFYASAQVMTSHAGDSITANGGVSPAVPLARVTLEFLNSSSEVLQTSTSDATVVPNHQATPSQFSPVSLQVPRDSVPPAATQVRMRVQMLPPYIRAETMCVWRPMLLPSATPPPTLGLPSFFSGSNAASSPYTFAWQSTANDSATVVTAILPTVWRVVQGQQFYNTAVTPAPPARISARSTSVALGSAPQVGFGHSLGSTLPAGQYTIGCKCKVSLESAPGVEVTSYAPVTVRIEFYNLETLVSRHDVGTIAGKSADTLQTLRGQGTLQVPGSFSEVRVSFISQRVDVAYLVAEMDSAYLTANDNTTVTNPIPRTDFNRVPNAGFERSLELWRTDGVAPTLVGGYNKPVAQMGSGSLLSGDIAITTGQKLHIQSYYRRTSSGNLNTSVRWCRRTRSNFALDPNFTTLTGKTGAANVTLSLSTAWFLSGPASLQVASAGAATGRVYPFGEDGAMARLGLKPGQGYVYSVSMRLASALTGTQDPNGRRIMVAVKRAGVWDINFAVSPQANNAAGVTRLSVSFILPPDTEDCHIRIVNGSPTVGESIWLDDQQLEDVSTTVRTNLAENPSAESAGGWTATSAAYTASRDTSVKRSGSQSAKCTLVTPSGTSLAYLQNVGLSGNSPVTLVNGQTYTFSVWVNTPSSGAAAQANLLPYLNGVAQTQVSGSSVSAPVNTWTRVSVTYTVPASGVVTVNPRVFMSATAPSAGAVAYFDDAQLELGAAPSAFFYGDVAGFTGTRYHWLGEANASVSREYTMATVTPATFFTGATASTGSVWYRWADPSNTVGSASEQISYTETVGVAGTDAALAESGSITAFNQVFQLLTAPANTDFAVIKYNNSAGVRLYWTYAGIDFPLHEEPGFYDAYPYWYFEGGGLDVFGNPVQWSGTADNSTSRVMPDFVDGWNYTLSPTGPNVHRVAKSAKSLENPPGSINNVGGLTRIAKGTNKTYRSVGYLVGSNPLMSGEVSVGVADGATVVLGLFGAMSSTASGVQLATQSFTASGKMQWIDLDVSAYTHVYLQVIYTEGRQAPGYRVRLDNFLLMPTTATLGGDYPGYFDGATSGGGWTGSPNFSTSQYYGGGRRCYAEVREAIDMTSMAGGTRAEFVVDMDVPGSLWEDLILSTFEASLPGSPDGLNQTLDLTQLAGTTAMIDDSVITVTPNGGALSNIILTDVATGFSLTITGSIAAGLPVVINNEQFTVKQGSTSWISRVTRSGNNANLLALTPVSSVLPPRLRVQATGADVGLTIKVVARRRYVLA